MSMLRIQFLRDGDCAEEVANIKRRLEESEGASVTREERVKRERPSCA